MKRVARILVPAALLLAALFWWSLRDSARSEAAIEASGTVEATEADLGFQLPGRVEAIHPEEGEEVSQGEELALLDRAELMASLEGARAAVAVAKALLREMEGGARPEEIAQAEAAVRAAQTREADALRDLGRARRLHEGGAVSREALDKAAVAHDVAVAGREQAGERLALARKGPTQEAIQAQRARVRQANAQVARMEASMRNATIHAPFDGVVSLRHREAGETVAPGSPVITIRRLDDRWVRIYVREDRIGRVKIGQEVTILSDGYPGRKYEGRVFHIGSEAEFTPRSVQTTEERVRLVYPVKVRIVGDPNEELKPGTPADVVLDVEADPSGAAPRS